MGQRADEARRKAEREAIKPVLKINYSPATNLDTFLRDSDYSITDQQGNIVKDKDGNPITFTRRFLRIEVENTTDNPAEFCKASLTVSSRPDYAQPYKPCRSPSRETKQLRWFSGELLQSIHAHDKEILEVIFSDSRGKNQIEKGFGAWLATKDAVMNPQLWYAPDQLCIGKTDVEITVQPRFGEGATTPFSIIVTTDWREISMKELEYE
jgi:hypothetical protein